MIPTHAHTKQYALIALFVGLFVAVEVVAGVWNEPGANTAPTPLVSIPVHTGLDQVKTGGLSVGTFIANQGASLKQETYFNGPLRGGTPADPHSQIAIGDTTTPVSATINGVVDAFAGLSSGALAHTSQIPIPVCADDTGTLGFCTIRDYCTNIAGVQSTIPQGMIYKSLNTCVYPPGAAVVGYELECIAAQANEWFAWDRQERGGFYKLNITLPKAPLADQKLLLRVGSSVPRWIPGVFASKTEHDAYYIVEGEKTIEKYWTNPDGPYDQVIANSPDSYFLSNPGNTSIGCGLDGKYPCTVTPWYVIMWNGIPIWQARYYDVDPIVINIPAGTKKVTVPYLGCYRAGKGRTLKWSYINTIEYKMEPTDPTDHDYILAAPMAREVKKL